MNIDYSVIIRTTGKAHEKYQNLLNSIEKLVPQPKEIIVVLPEGYDTPDEKLGWESYYFCKKGMVIQRLTGIAKCKTKYALVCDDDVSFAEDFVQKLYKPISENLCKLSAGPLYSFLPSGKNAIICTVMADAPATVFHKNRYCSVLRTTGYSYNKKLTNGKYYEAQSLPWTCFFGDVDAMRNIKLDDELWLDSHGYASLDDQTMFYKGWLRGENAMVVPEALYSHLDGKTSVNNAAKMHYCSGYNRVVFWHRFIYSQQKNVFARLWSRVCFRYSTIWKYAFLKVTSLLKHTGNENYNELRKGYKDGKSYVKSAEYKNLRSV